MKQVILVNEALQLPRGKLAAQVSHAAVAAFLTAAPQAQRAWLEAGMPKVVLRCDCEAELLELEARALAAKLPVEAIRDAGHTVIAAGTLTCVGIGPASPAEIDAITGALKLVR